MEHKCLNIFVLTLLFCIDSVYNRPKSLKHHQQDDIFDMVKADRVVEAANEDFRHIEGMEERADGKLYFNGERVKSVSTLGGDKIFDQSEAGSDYETDQSEAISEEDKLDDKLEGLGDITNMEEIKKMTSIKNIEG